MPSNQAESGVSGEADEFRGGDVAGFGTYALIESGLEA